MELMPRVPVDSSHLKEIGHDPFSNHMHVQFKAGDVYDYHPVSRQQHEDLMNAESVGKHFNEHIRDNPDINYTKLVQGERKGKVKKGIASAAGLGFLGGVTDNPNLLNNVTNNAQQSAIRKPKRKKLPGEAPMDKSEARFAEALERTVDTIESGPGIMDMINKSKKAKLGSGGRFKAIEKKAAKEGEKNPSAVAAAIGMKAHGKKKMEKWAKAEKKKASK